MKTEDPNERDKILLGLLAQRLKNARKELREQERELAEHLAQPVLVRDEGITETLSHTVGYLTAAVYELDFIIGLLSKSKAGLDEYILEKRRIERKNRKALEEMCKQVEARLKESRSHAD